MAALGVPALVLAVTVVAGGALRSDTLRRDHNVMLVYVGAENCAPCVAWRRVMGADFRASVEFSRLRYREVEAHTLFEVLNDDVWPVDLRSYRARIDRANGVPMWLVVADGQVVAQGFGVSEWQKSVLPTLVSLVR